MPVWMIRAAAPRYRRKVAREFSVKIAKIGKSSGVLK
jgi:hypothetical protein